MNEITQSQTVRAVVSKPTQEEYYISVLDEKFLKLPIDDQINLAVANECAASKAKDWIGMSYWQGIKHYLWIIVRK
jgi:hypothetical protein